MLKIDIDNLHSMCVWVGLTKCIAAPISNAAILSPAHN